MKFKVGDLVYCIDPSPPEVKGEDVEIKKQIYLVVDCNEHQIKLKNGYSYTAHRFIKANHYSTKLGKILYKDRTNA